MPEQTAPENDPALALRRAQQASQLQAQAQTAQAAQGEAEKKKQSPQAQWIKGFKNVALDGFMAALIVPFPWIHLKYLIREVRTAIDPTRAMGGALGGKKSPLPEQGPSPMRLGSSALEPLSPPEKVFSKALNAVAFYVYAGMLVALIMMAVAYYVCEEKLFGLLSADTCLSIVGTFASP